MPLLVHLFNTINHSMPCANTVKLIKLESTTRKWLKNIGEQKCVHVLSHHMFEINVYVSCEMILHVF